MSDGFKSLKEVFNKEPELKKIRDVVKSSDIVNDFNIIFPDLKKIVTAVKSNKSTLIIKVENPVWRQELKHSEENIINKINSFYNEERIKQIRFS
jgi:chaperonin cofactor prefoldin